MRTLIVFMVALAIVALVSLLIASQQLTHVASLEAAAIRALRRPVTASATAAAAPRASLPLAAGAAEERACAELLAASSNVMFMVLGGRGYHAVRVRVAWPFDER